MACSFRCVVRSVVAIALLGFGLAPVRAATVANVITNPVFVNIYWDANFEADTKIPESAVDAFVSALTKSTYFAGLGEYGVGGASFFGSFHAAPACGNGGTSPNAISLFGLPTDLTIQGFIECEVQQAGVPSGPNVVYNILLAPTTIEKDEGAWISTGVVSGLVLDHIPLPLSLLLGFLPPEAPGALPFAFSSCRSVSAFSQTLGYDAYHFHGSMIGGPVFTLIFTNPDCLQPSGFPGLTANLTHEMVEAVTDPFPSLSILLQGGGGEIADACDNQQPSPFLNRFRGGVASQFFSNRGGSCIVGFSDRTMPRPAAVQFSINSSLKACPEAACPAPFSVAVTGKGFGILPAGAITTAATASLTPYFALGDATTGATSGNAIDADTSGLQYGPWSDGSILVGAPNVVPGHLIEAIVCNPASGQCSNSSPATAPPTVAAVAPNQGPAAGGSWVGVNGNGFSTAPGGTVFRFGGGGASNVQCPTPQFCTMLSPQGSGFVDVTATVAGATSPASAADRYAYTAPDISLISPDLGPVSGGTPVTISGTGFSTPTTAISFQNVQLGASCSSGASCSLDSPHSPIIRANGVGSVEVTATVAGMTSPVGAPTDTFLYYIDLSPVLYTAPTCGGLSPRVEASVYHDSAPVQTPQHIQFTFAPQAGGPPQQRSVQTANGAAAVAPPASGAWTVTAANLSAPASTPPSAPVTIMAVSIPCPKPVGAWSPSGVGAWNGGPILPVLPQCHGGPCPGPLQQVVWTKRVGVDPGLPAVMLRVDTAGAPESASGIHVTVDDQSQASATFREASGVEVLSTMPVAVDKAYFVGPVVQISADAHASAVARTLSTAAPPRGLRLTVPYAAQGVPAAATVGVFWLRSDAKGGVWTNAGVRIVAMARNAVTAEIPHAGSFTVVAFNARAVTAAPAKTPPAARPK